MSPMGSSDDWRTDDAAQAGPKKKVSVRGLWPSERVPNSCRRHCQLIEMAPRKYPEITPKIPAPDQVSGYRGGTFLISRTDAGCQQDTAAREGSVPASV